jgi:hypothetical protein
MSFRPLLAAVCITVAGVLLIAPSAHAAAPGSVQVSGTQLESALPPTAYFGSGYSPRKLYSSGSQVMRYYPPATGPASETCVDLSGLLGIGGFGATAWAFEGVFSVQAPYSPEIDQFPDPRIASSVFTALRVKLASCRSFITPASKGVAPQHVSQSVTAADVDGHGAVLVSQTIGFSDLPDLYSYSLLTIDGSDLFLADMQGSSYHHLPARPSLTAITVYMIGKVSALR